MHFPLLPDWVLGALGHPPLMRPASHVGPRTLDIGRDPIRVLGLGGGLAIGSGVRTRAQAFHGSLGPVGTRTFHVAVWCPSFAEGLERLRLSSRRTELHQMMRDLRVEDHAALVLSCIPVPAGFHPAALIARPWVHRLNRVIKLVAAEWDDVLAVDTVPFVPADIGKPITDAAYFAAVAGQIAPAVVRLATSPSVLARR